MERLCCAAPLAALILLAAGPALAAPAPDHDDEHQVVVEKIVLGDCAGEECDEETQVRRMILVEGDEIHELDGEEVHRLRHGDGHHHLLHRAGEGGFLGVATNGLTPELRRHFGVPEEVGLLVARVVENSAAASAGVLVGDILTALDGEALRSPRDLVHQIRRREPGAAVSLELWRDGVLETVAVTLGERQRSPRRVLVRHCEEGDADCPRIAALEEYGCGGEGPCEVRIECRDGGCDCSVNGESTECETIPGFVAPGE